MEFSLGDSGDYHQPVQRSHVIGYENVRFEEQESSGTRSQTKPSDSNDGESVTMGTDMVCSSHHEIANIMDPVETSANYASLRSRLLRNRERAERTRQRRLQEQSAAQLLLSQLEEQCAQLRGENTSLWRQFIVCQVRWSHLLKL